MSLSVLTPLHVALSLLALVYGVIVIRGLLHSRLSTGVTALFLISTAATSLTGFLYPVRLGLGQVVGVLSLALLAPTVFALYACRLTGAWRAIYAAGATGSVYLGMVIVVAQTFKRVEILQPLMPSLTAPAFLAAEAAVLAVFVLLGEHAMRRFHPSLPRIGRPRAFPRHLKRDGFSSNCAIGPAQAPLRCERWADG